MATLSGFNITKQSVASPDSGRRLGIAEGGQIRGRNTFEQTVFNLVFIIHTDVTGASDLDDFYNLYSDIWNLASIDGVSYTWLFANRPSLLSADGTVRIVTFNATGYAA